MSEFDTGIVRDEPFDRGDVELIAAQIPTFEVAQLLRAAPDLYAACKAALTCCWSDSEYDHRVIATIHAAIARAEGKEATEYCVKCGTENKAQTECGLCWPCYVDASQAERKRRKRP